MTPLNNPALSSAESLLRCGAALSLMYAMIAGFASVVDGRTLAHENIWLKPLKFGFSLAIYLSTLLCATRTLSTKWRSGRAALFITGTAGLCSGFELVYIGIQAARGQASHFNVGTSFHAALYGLMAIAAIALVLCSAALGIVIALDSAIPALRTVRWGISVSILLSAALTILTGVSMGGRLTHHVGVEVAGAVRVPIAGWSLTVGDMRVPHFFGTHLMQAGTLFA